MYIHFSETFQSSNFYINYLLSSHIRFLILLFLCNIWNYVIYNIYLYISCWKSYLIRWRAFAYNIPKNE